MRTIRFMFKARRNRELDQKFVERLMLRVTEVNDCALCSYAHSKRALESGMTSEEIQKNAPWYNGRCPCPGTPGSDVCPALRRHPWKPHPRIMGTYSGNLWAIQSQRYPGIHTHHNDWKHLWYSLELIFQPVEG